MPKRKQTKNSKEKDSTYLLKIVLYFMLGMLWLRIEVGNSTIPLPIGFGLGLVFAAHEHFRIDRKIEYAILVTAMFVSYWLPVGILVGVS